MGILAEMPHRRPCRASLLPSSRLPCSVSQELLWGKGYGAGRSLPSRGCADVLARSRGAGAGTLARWHAESPGAEPWAILLSASQAGPSASGVPSHRIILIVAFHNPFAFYRMARRLSRMAPNRDVFGGNSIEYYPRLSALLIKSADQQSRAKGRRGSQGRFHRRAPGWNRQEKRDGLPRQAGP